MSENHYGYMGWDKYSLFGPCKVQLEDEDAKFEINAASSGNLDSFLEGTYRMIHKTSRVGDLKHLSIFQG